MAGLLGPGTAEPSVGSPALGDQTSLGRPLWLFLFLQPRVPCCSLGAAQDLAPLPSQRRVTGAGGCPPRAPCGTGRRRPPGGCSCPRLRRAAAAPPGPPPWPRRRPRAGSAGRRPPGCCDEAGAAEPAAPTSPPSPAPGRCTDSPEQGLRQHAAPVARGSGVSGGRPP